MAELPPDVEYVRTTDVFDQDRHPAGLRRAHRVAAGVWARLVVHSGRLEFVFEDDAAGPVAVAAGDSIVIPPGVPHHVDIVGPVTFALEFHREAGEGTPGSGQESTGLTS